MTVTNEVKVPVEATHVEALVAADAGASLSIGNKIQLTVPAGALSEDANISVTKGAVVAPKENLVPISTSLEMGGHGIEFNKPVALNVCYDASALVSQNLKEETVQVYYVDPLTGEYAAVGGNVNLAAHCVSAQLTHFSTYLIAAQILQGGNNAPVISAPTFTPTVPMAGLPLKISSVVTDYELTAVNGQIGFGQVATATLYYRIPGEPSFTQVALTPDTLDDTATRYSYKIPANRVTTAGIEYYLKATDNLGANRIRNTVTLPIARTATGIAFQTTVAVDLAAGFKRSYTLRGIDDLGAQRNIEVDSFAVNNGIGTAAKISASVVQFTATTANAQNYRVGSISATAGSFNTTSPDIRVHAGYLDHIALLSPTGVVLGNSITVNANSTYDFDVLGYDAYGNTTNILPQFVIVPVSGAGTITPTGLYTAPATAQTATLVATLDGVMDSILINVVIPDQVINLGTAGCQNYNPGLSAQGGLLAVACNSGVLIFRKGGSGQWALNQTLQTLDNTGHYAVPSATAISGDYLAVRTTGDTAGIADVKIFKKDASDNFTQTATLTNPNPPYGFSPSVAMNSNQIFVGLSSLGEIYVYEKDIAGESWSLRQTLTNAGGDSIAATNQYLIAGGTFGAGQAFVFERDVNGIWNFVQQLSIGSGGQHSAVAVKGTRILVGRETGPDPRSIGTGG
ncbi:MAG: hypothetical protein J0L53_18515, partial [Spirochaetes bacterium]|nr:hypothetical protein [Spirochaetota bacterium]